MATSSLAFVRSTFFCRVHGHGISARMFFTRFGLIRMFSGFLLRRSFGTGVGCLFYSRCVGCAFLTRAVFAVGTGRNCGLFRIFPLSPGFRHCRVRDVFMGLGGCSSPLRLVLIGVNPALNAVALPGVGRIGFPASFLCAGRIFHTGTGLSADGSVRLKTRVSTRGRSAPFLRSHGAVGATLPGGHTLAEERITPLQDLRIQGRDVRDIGSFDGRSIYKSLTGHVHGDDFLFRPPDRNHRPRHGHITSLVGCDDGHDPSLRGIKDDVFNGPDFPAFGEAKARTVNGAAPFINGSDGRFG